MEIHEWLPTKLGRDILTQKYLQPGETLDQFFDRVSGGDPKVRKLIVEKRFLPAGRILSALTLLEVKGYVKRLPARYYELAKK